MIDALPPDRFAALVEDAAAAVVDDERRLLRAAAFVGWQLAAMHGKRIGSFGAYLKRLGLDDDGG